MLDVQEMRGKMRTLFRYLLDEQGLQDHSAFLPRFKEGARELAEIEDNPSLRNLEPALKTFESWYYGRRQPQKDARRVLIRLFGYSIEQLWSEVPPGTTPEPPPLFSTHATDNRASNGTALDDMRRTAQMAARRAVDFAMGAERGQLGQETLGLLTDKVQSIVDEYPRVPLSKIWEDIAETQDDVFRLLEGGRARPSQIRELNVLATILSFHMAKGCHDMGDAKLAMTQARAAGVCAQQSEHPGLVALTYGLKSLITFWSNKGSEALHYARQGAAECPNGRGTVGVWLASLEARAAALLGDADAARTANRRADSLRKRVVPDDLDELGGLLTFSERKHLYYSVESLVLLGHGDAELVSLAEEAVRGLSDPGSPDWAFGDQAGAHCNLALTRLYGGEVDGAAEAIRPVLDLAPALRNRGIVVSANRVGAALVQGTAHEIVVARDLREEIEAYSPNRLSLPR